MFGELVSLAQSEALRSHLEDIVEKHRKRVHWLVSLTWEVEVLVMLKGEETRKGRLGRSEEK